MRSFSFLGESFDAASRRLVAGFILANAVLLSRHYGSVEERARIDAPLARPWDTDLPVYVCRERLSPPDEFWSELRRFDHRLAPRD